MAQKAHLHMEQGVDFSAQIELMSYYNDVMYDLSGATIMASMRKDYTSTVSHDFVCSIDNATGGTFVLAMPWEETINIDPGRYLYDVVAETSDGGRIRIIEGRITVSAGITR